MVNFLKYISKKVTTGTSKNKCLKLWSMLFNGKGVLMAKFQSTNTQNPLWVEVHKFIFIFLRVFTKDQGNLWVCTVSISYYLNWLGSLKSVIFDVNCIIESLSTFWHNLLVKCSNSVFYSHSFFLNCMNLIHRPQLLAYITSRLAKTHMYIFVAILKAVVLDWPLNIYTYNDC